MLKEIIAYELKYRFKRPSTYVYFGIFFFVLMLLVAMAATTMKGGSVHLFGIDSTKLFVNSAYAIFSTISFTMLFSMFVYPAIFGRSIYRDFEYETHSIYFTLPISKFGYVMGRFIGSYIMAIGIGISMLLGVWAAQFFPTVNSARFDSFDFYSYFNPFMQIIVPNTFFIGVIMFSMVLIFRDIMSVYVANVILFVGYFIAFSMISDVESQQLAALLDPFGIISFMSSTRYWTIDDKNMFQVPITLMVIANRLLYFGVASAIFAFAYRRFQLSIFNTTGKSKAKSVENEVVAAPKTAKIFGTEYLLNYSAKSNRSHLWRLVKHEFWGLVNTFYFKVLLVTAAVLLMIEPVQIGLGDVENIPFTGYFLQNMKAGFLIFGIIILTFCSGELVWFERNKRISPLYDSLPMPSWLPYLSKLSALLLSQFIFMFVIIICGVVLQTAKGYFNYELDIYFKDLFGFTIWSYLLYAALTMFVHVMVNNKFVGHFVMLAFYITSIFYSDFGINHLMLKYADAPTLRFSEMNNFGHSWLPFYSYTTYWVLFAALLSVVAYLFWIRGNETNFKFRTKLARARFTKPVRNLTIILVVLFVATGSFIFYNTRVLNQYQTAKEAEQFSVDYELKYSKLEKSQNLSTTNVKVNVDLFPYERSFKMKGTYWLKNKTNKPIDSVVVYLNHKLKINSITLNKTFTILSDDNKFGYHIYKLAEPAQPNDSVLLSFDYEYISKGFVNNSSSIKMVYNGTFLSSEMWVPTIGYNSSPVLEDDDTREKYGLKPIDRMNSINDTTQYRVPMGGDMFRLINFEAVVSTSPDQIAIAPGRLVKEWTENNRRYFHYKPERKIVNFFSFLSGKYQVKRDKVQDIDLEIYYIAKHPHNVDKMMASMKSSLKYYSTNYSPFQYKNLRIVEFPYDTYAQSFATTIPFSENIGFTEKVDTEKTGIDHLAFVTDHEIGHQWWAHQVIAANVQGATFVIEVLTQYSALMVMKDNYSPKQMAKYTRYELDKYLRGRTREKKKEMPIYLVENQGYLHYQKGIMVMWALYDYIGEKNINAALRNVIKDYAFSETIYPTSINVLKRFKEVTPDSLQYIYTDMFETITLYSNRATSATYTKTANGKYLVKLNIESKKFRADSLGKENEIPVNDWIDISVLNKDDEAIFTQKRKIDKKQMTFEIVVDKEPAKAGIDAFHKLIDRDINDNVKDVELKK